MSRKKVVAGVGVLLLLLVSGFVIWGLTPLGPSQEAENALTSTSNVTFTDNDGYLTFTPTNNEPTTGLIYYPGGRVAEESYAPFAQMVAEKGFLVVIVPMPLHLAVFGVDRAQNVIDNHPSIDTWSIAGHSLGGSMAAQFVHDNPDTMEALYLLASYPADGASLADRELEVMSIYGTNDEVLTQDIPDTSSLLPADANITAIEGGNHAYFGYYGEQNGDGDATISRAEQHQISVDLITQSLASL